MVSDSFAFVLFGATGDLAGKKILPALFQLYRYQRIPPNFILIGNGRTPRSDQDFQQLVYSYISKQFPTLDQATWDHFRQHLFYVTGNAGDKGTIEKIGQKLQEISTQYQVKPKVMFHVATLPELYANILTYLGQWLNANPFRGWVRLLIEKPFGVDLDSSIELNQLVKRYFNDEQVFRIDHFLGKETVQNMLAFRFANGLFESLWNHRYIDHIQITALETEGVDGREIFYDATGVLRDFIQNHVLQLLALVMMEQPRSLDSQFTREKRLELLNQLQCYNTQEAYQNIVYGQYGIGKIEGEEKRAYIQEANIPNTSQTETFAALKLLVNSPRWRTVPIYIRAGKRLAAKVTEISIQFKDPKNLVPEFRDQMSANVLTFRIQPNEGIILRLDAKKPGHGYSLHPVSMQFGYIQAFSQAPLIEAYERLIADAWSGNHLLFPTAEEVEAAWRFIDPLLQVRTGRVPIMYPAGSLGPQEAYELIRKDKREWIEPD